MPKQLPINYFDHIFPLEFKPPLNLDSSVTIEWRVALYRASRNQYFRLKIRDKAGKLLHPTTQLQLVLVFVQKQANMAPIPFPHNPTKCINMGVLLHSKPTFNSPKSEPDNDVIIISNFPKI